MPAARNIFITVRTSWSLYASGLKGSQSKQLQAEAVELTLPETNSSPLKISGWKMKFPFGMAYFQGACISLGEGKSTVKTKVSNFG